jgi:hypothetical protein
LVDIGELGGEEVVLVAGVPDGIRRIDGGRW